MCAEASNDFPVQAFDVSAHYVDVRKKIAHCKTFLNIRVISEKDAAKSRKRRGDKADNAWADPSTSFCQRCF